MVCLLFLDQPRTYVGLLGDCQDFVFYDVGPPPPPPRQKSEVFIITLYPLLQTVKHGGCLGLGLAAMTSKNSDIYEQLKNNLYQV